MPIYVAIRDLEKSPLSLKGDLDAGEILVPADGDMACVLPPIRYELVAALDSNLIRVTGSWAVSLDCTCVRCLRGFRLLLTEGNYCDSIDSSSGDRCLKEGEPGVDLSPHLREDIFLSLPRNPLCSIACCGLAQELNVEAGNVGFAPKTSAEVVWADLDKLGL